MTLTDYISLVNFNEDLTEKIWEIGYSHHEPEWAKWDGPYFEDQSFYESYELFRQSKAYDFLLNGDCRCIILNDTPVGMVSRYWENKKTRWMELGILIFDEDRWNKGIGTAALECWITDTFNSFPEIERTGLTTWSGNLRMMKAAEKLGLLKEAHIRKVRYWNGFYYDSVKYGVLRDEWFDKKNVGTSFMRKDIDSLQRKS